VEPDHGERRNSAALTESEARRETKTMKVLGKSTPIMEREFPKKQPFAFRFLLEQ
jgi:hypothetical protein